MSKFASTDEWEVTEEFFQYVDGLYEPHDIDRFATSRNRKIKRFNSLFVNY